MTIFQKQTETDTLIGRFIPTMSLRISERRGLLFIVDLFIINLALYLSVGIQRSFDFSGVPDFRVYLWFVLASVLWLAFSNIFDCYDLRESATASRIIPPIILAAFLTAFINLFIPLLSPALPERRLYILLFPVFAIVGLTLWRFFYATILARAEFSRRMIILGLGQDTRQLLENIPTSLDQETLTDSFLEYGFQILGFVDDDDEKQESSFHELSVIGTSEELDALVEKHNIDDVVVGIRDVTSINDETFSAILDCHEHGVNVTMLINLYETITGRVPVEHVGPNLHMVLPMKRPTGHRLYLLIQRVIDVIGAIFGCVILALLIPVIWVGNRFTDPGDIFYLQERVGLKGKPFKVMKFRSMVTDAEKFSGAVWAEENDPRITPMGRFMRKTRIDEVPQFWNVMKGEMSLVGPRPERPHFVDQLAEQIPYFRARHAVKPGITGWAQVNYKYGASVEDSQAKLEYDLYYIKNQGLPLDFQTLLKTVQVIVGMRGR